VPLSTPDFLKGAQGLLGFQYRADVLAVSPERGGTGQDLTPDPPRFAKSDFKVFRSGWESQGIQGRENVLLPKTATPDPPTSGYAHDTVCFCTSYSHPRLLYIVPGA